MSVTPVDVHRHSNSEEGEEDCEQCQHSQLESGSSSEQEESDVSDSFVLKVDQTGLQGAVLRLQKLEEEMAKLRVENERLTEKNLQLVRRLQRKEGEKELKRQLKAKEVEIRQLKNQVSQNSYGMSHNSKSSHDSGIQSNNFMQFQQKKYRLGSNIGRKHQRPRQKSVGSPKNQGSQFRDEVQRQQWRVERLLLQREVCRLQQAMLVYELEMKWAMNLAGKVVNLGYKLGYLFKEKVVDSRWDVRRQAKAAWRYLKHCLNYFLQVQ